MLLAAIAGPGLVALATLPDPAQAVIARHSAWKSSAPFAKWSNGGFTVRNNVLNTAAAGRQTIWADSYRSWGVESTQPNTSGTKAYPSVQRYYPNQPTYSSLRHLRSRFRQFIPSAANLSAEAAYDVWLNNHTVEVMMWVNNHNQYPAGHVIGTINIYHEISSSGGMARTSTPSCWMDSSRPLARCTFSAPCAG
jgi:hypothetical protein